MNNTARLVVGICDDAEFIHKEVDELIDLYRVQNLSESFEIETIHYYSGNELLEKDDSLDVLFLDIDMPGIDGIEAGKKLRKRGRDYKIAMLTGVDSRAQDVSEVEIFRFLLKPIEREVLFEALDVLKERVILKQRVKVSLHGKIYEIEQKDICYIYAKDSETFVRTKNCEYNSGVSLGKWMEILDEKRFIQCHKSYIVNMAYIDNVKKNRIELFNKERVEIARRKLRLFEQRYHEFDVKWR